MLEEDRRITAPGNEWHFQADASLPVAEGHLNSLGVGYPGLPAVFHASGFGMHLADLCAASSRLEQLLP